MRVLFDRCFVTNKSNNKRTIGGLVSCQKRSSSAQMTSSRFRHRFMFHVLGRTHCGVQLNQFSWNSEIIEINCFVCFLVNQKLIQPSFEAEYVLTGDRHHFLIKKATVEAKYFFRPYGQEGGQMSSHIRSDTWKGIYWPESRLLFNYISQRFTWVLYKI